MYKFDIRFETNVFGKAVKESKNHHDGHGIVVCMVLGFK